MPTLALVACAAQKAPAATRAADLYVSTWFRLARAYVERRRWPWRILSAMHGLLDPAQIVAPYDATLIRQGAAGRRQWAAGVFAGVVALAPPTTRIVILAGEAYRRDLVPLLLERRYVVDVPMVGLGIGEQLAWLSQRTRARGIGVVG